MAKNVAMILFMALILTACDRGLTSKGRQNIQVAERLLGEVWSNGNVEILDEIIGDDYVKHWATFEPIIGRDQLKQEVQEWRESFPDCNYKINAIEASDDMVFVRYTETGTFTNDFYDLRANGKAVNVAGTVWLLFENGRIVEDWSMVDEWGTQIQLETDFPKEWLYVGWD